MNEKCVVLGLDGATFDLLEPWANDGVLPTFKMLMEEGTYGKLRSSIPPVTFPAWKCYSTGKNPGKLGVYSFQIVDVSRREMHLANSSSFQCDEIWDLIGKLGLKSIVFNMPTTYPPKTINGTMISGPFAASEDVARPTQVLDEIRERFPKYEPGFSFLRNRMWDTDVITSQILDNILDVIQERFTIIRYLLKKKRWSLFNAVIYVTDIFQHRLWKEQEKMMTLWMEIDRQLGKTIEDVKNIDIFLVSDHGFGPNKRNVYVNDLLERAGYLVFKRNFSRIGLSKAEIRRVLSLAKLGFVSDFLPDSLFAHSLGLVDNLDWNKTTAFAVADGVCGQIYINTSLSSSEDEQESLKREISDYINSSFRRELGVSARVYRREEIYSGEYVFRGPDLIVMPSQEGHPVKSRACDKGFDLSEDRNWFGSHRMDGLFLAYGPNIRENNKIGRIKIVDVASTLLNLLNLPVPKEMDGDVLVRQVFRSSSEICKRRPRFQEEEAYGKAEHILAADEEKKIEDKLKRLGYF